MLTKLEKQNKELVETLIQLNKEKETLLNTLENQNAFIKELKEVKESYDLLIEHNETFYDAIFVILFSINKYGDLIDSEKLNEIFSVISTVAVNSLMNNSIKEQFEVEIEKGEEIANRIARLCQSKEPNQSAEIEVSIFESEI